MSLDHRNVQIKYHDKPNDLPIDLRVPLQVETVNDLKCLLKANYLFNPRTQVILFKPNISTTSANFCFNDHKIVELCVQYKCVYIYPKDNPMVDTKALGLSEELDRNITKLCEEMSALKASNESEVKALKAQLKSSNDTMKTMVEKIEILEQKLMTCDKRSDKLKHKLNEMSTENSELREELSALKASKHIIESKVKQMAQEINHLNLRCTVNDFSSKSSSIGSHNQLTTNSDKTRDEINIQEILNEIKNQNKMTFNFMRGLIRDKENKDMRVLAEDTDDSESIASVGKNFGFK